MDAPCKVSLRFTDKHTIILWAFVSVFLVSFVIIPLLVVLLKPGVTDYANVVGRNSFLIALKNTLSLCFLSSFFSVLVGYLYAYGMVYTKIPFKKFFAIVPLVHLILPPSVSSLSFILLLGKSGFITKGLLQLDVSLYGIRAVVISQVMCFFPIAYIICYQHLKTLNHSIESAASSMGACWHKVFFLTFRMSLQAVLQSFFFISVLVISDFGNPAVLAGRFRVLALEIYTSLTGWIDINSSAVYAIFLMIISLTLFAVQSYIEKYKKNKSALVGQGGYSGVDLIIPFSANVAFIAFCIFIFCCILSQILSVVVGAFQNVWGADPFFTLKHIAKIGNATSEIRNSLSFAFVASLVSVAISMTVAYITQKANCRFKKFLTTSIRLPSAAPGVLFGLAFVIISSFLGIDNSRLFIIIAMTIGFMPFSYRIISSKLSELSPLLDDASFSCGAGRFETFFKITLPLIFQSVLASFLYTFVRSIGTLSAVVFLVSFDTPLVSVKILNLVEQGFWGDAAALSLFLMLIIFLILLLLFAILKMEKKRGRAKESFIFL